MPPEKYDVGLVVLELGVPPAVGTCDDPGLI